VELFMSKVEFLMLLIRHCCLWY